MRSHYLLAGCIMFSVLLTAGVACRKLPAPIAAVPQQAKTHGSPTVVRHDMRVTLAPEAHTVAVEDTLTGPGLQPSFTLHAGLSPSGGGTGAIEPEPSGERSRVPLERVAVTASAGHSITVRYRGVIDHPIAATGEEYARSFEESPGVISAAGVVLSGSSVWVPRFADDTLVTFTAEVHAPSGWDVVMPGDRIAHERGASGTVSTWQSRNPIDDIVLVASPFHETERRVGDVAIQAFLRQPDASLAGQYLDATQQYLAMYGTLLGRYPYGKFALVENFWETGYGLPSFTLLGPKIIRMPFILLSSYPHEILHNWWGNGVFVDPSGGNWCEGLTAYLADHMLKEQRGQGAEYRRSSLQKYADYVSTSRDFPIREFESRHGAATQAVGYDKLLMVFHMLRRELGDRTFVAALRSFYRDELFQRASFDDLIRAFSDAAGRDLGPWFAQWIDRPGAPALRIVDARATQRHGKWIVRGVVEQTQEGDVFTLAVPVAVTVEGAAQATVEVVPVRARRQDVEIELEARPLRLDLDPEFDAFRRLDRDEIPPSFGAVFGAERVSIVLPASAPALLRDAYRALAESWRVSQPQSTDVVTDSELKSLPNDRAVWLFGWDNAWVARLTDGVRALGVTRADGTVRFGTAELERARNSVALAVRNPDAPAQSIAWVAASSAAAVPGLGRKLPHYGKYGLLGFEGDEPTNVVKETFGATSAATTVRLGETGELAPRGGLPDRKPLAELPQPHAAADG